MASTKLPSTTFSKMSHEATTEVPRTAIVSSMQPSADTTASPEIVSKNNDEGISTLSSHQHSELLEPSRPADQPVPATVTASVEQERDAQMTSSVTSPLDEIHHTGGLFSAGRACLQEVWFSSDVDWRHPYRARQLESSLLFYYNHALSFAQLCAQTRGLCTSNHLGST